MGASKKGVALACLDAARPALQTVFHSFSLLTLPGDAGTWSVTVFISSNDQALKKLRDPKHWTALVAACPLHAHCLDGEPDLRRAHMGGILDRYRRFVDGVPDRQCRRLMGPARTRRSRAGLPWALCTALGTREVVQQHLDNPLALLLAQDSMTETRLTPLVPQHDRDRSYADPADPSLRRRCGRVVRRRAGGGGAVRTTRQSGASH